MSEVVLVVAVGGFVLEVLLDLLLGTVSVEKTAIELFVVARLAEL